MRDRGNTGRGGRGWPLQAYFAVVGAVVVAAGLAAGVYVLLQARDGELRAQELGIIAFGVLLTLLVLAFVYRQVARPMSALADAVRAGRGLDTTMPASGPAQVADLGASVNELIATVRSEASERENAERRYGELFEGNPLPSLIIRSRTLEIVDVNRAAVEALGYSRQEFTRLKTSDLVVPDDSIQAQQIQRNRDAESATLRYGPLSFKRKDGSLMRVMGTSYVVEYRQERVRVAMLEDVTEKEKIERQMQQAQRLESLGQLAGGVAHDFNNLLTVILNVTSSLKKSVADEEAARDVERVDKAARSASRLTHQLLAFARREVVPQTVLNVSDELDDLKELLSRTIGSHIALTMDLPREVWPVIMDRGQLEQIVINLAVNARDAMPRGGRLTISAENSAVDAAYAAARPGLAAGDYVELQIADSGTGMDKKTLEHAFEPFFTTKPVGQGTGLGLATVYGIVKQLNGHIALYSEVGKGTTITVLVPKTSQQAVVDAPAAAPARRPSTGTILVVEDYADLRELFEEILKGSGFRVITAPDGAAAVAAAAEHEGEIDLLLTDIVMPNMLGTDLARELQMKHPDLRVLFMSGHAQPVIGAATPLPPGARLLQKPFLEAELLAKLGEVLEAPAEAELRA